MWIYELICMLGAKQNIKNQDTSWRKYITGHKCFLEIIKFSELTLKAINHFNTQLSTHVPISTIKGSAFFTLHVFQATCIKLKSQVHKKTEQVVSIRNLIRPTTLH